MTSEEGMRQASIVLIQTFWGVLGIRWIIRNCQNWRRRRKEREAKRFLTGAAYRGWDRWSHFMERGYTVIAYLPTQRISPPQFMVKIFRGGKEVREFYSSMTYEPIFGPDAGDVASLERATSRVLKELP